MSPAHTRADSNERAHGYKQNRGSKALSHFERQTGEKVVKKKNCITVHVPAEVNAEDAFKDLYATEGPSVRHVYMYSVTRLLACRPTSVLARTRSGT